jgi:hypothetical protein
VQSGRSVSTFQRCLLPQDDRPDDGCISETSVNFYQTKWCINPEVILKKISVHDCFKIITLKTNTVGEA